MKTVDSLFSQAGLGFRELVGTGWLPCVRWDNVKNRGSLFSQAGSGSWNGTGQNTSSSDGIISQPPS